MRGDSPRPSRSAAEPRRAHTRRQQPQRPIYERDREILQRALRKCRGCSTWNDGEGGNKLNRDRQDTIKRKALAILGLSVHEAFLFAFTASPAEEGEGAP